MITRKHCALPLRLLRDAVRPSGATSSLELPAVSSTPSRLFTTTPSLLHKSKNYKPRKYVDSWVLRQRQQKRVATAARLRADAERKQATMGDPIRGAPAPTPFVSSFDTGIEPGHRMVKPVEFDASPSSETGVGDSLVQDEQGREQNLSTGADAIVSREADPKAPRPQHLNHFVELDELDSDLRAFREISSPLVLTDRSVVDPQAEQSAAEEHAKVHASRAEALKRILAPEHASGRERLLLNRRRCVERFGRHNTDKIFPLPEPSPSQPNPSRKERVGPDTGSSEVQIAILTAKIRTLANNFESSKGQFDWINKRNLRILLHRRQKLLRYFEKKERGGQRWHHLIETLGLTEATWKGEIELR